MDPVTDDLIQSIERLMDIIKKPIPTQNTTTFQYNPADYGIAETIRVLCTELQDRLAPNRPKDHSTPSLIKGIDPSFFR